MKECPTCQRCYDDVMERCPEDESTLTESLEGPPILGNKYRIERRLGIGGMGAIYTGVDERLGRRVALKGIRDQRVLDSATKARLLREARILSQLDHPNICRIYDFIEIPGGAFMVLELIDGRTLKSAMREVDLSERSKMDIAFSIASVLAAAHGAGVIHRDLKPENVMLANDGGIKVLDFGIARPLDVVKARRAESEENQDDSDQLDTDELADASITLPGLVLGTPQYMSPEQARSKKLTTASDMYSFGLLLQELFTGRPAYDTGLPLGRLLLKVTEGDTRTVDGLEPSLAVLIARLKSPAPEARPTAVDAMSHLTGIRDAPRRRLQRRVQLAAIAALTVLAIILAFQSHRIQQVAERAEEQAQLAVGRRLIAEAATLRNGQLDLALLLALEAQGMADSVEERSAILGSLAASPRLRRFLRGHPARVEKVAWSADGKLLAASSYSNIRLWKPETGELAAEIATQGGSVWALAFSPDGRLLASASNDSAIRLWHVDEQRREETLIGHRAAVHALAWSSDGQTLASAGNDRTVRLWDLGTGEQLVEGMGGHRDSIHALAWADDSKLLASAGLDGQIRLWDATSRQPLGMIGTHMGAVEALAFNNRGHLLSAGADGMVRFWDITAGTSAREPLAAHPTGVTSLTLSRDGDALATGGRDQTIRLFQLDSGGLMLANEPSWSLVGHDDEVLSVAWSPDGSRLASASIDRSIALWDRVAMRPEARIMQHEGWVSALAASADGRLLASAAFDRTVRLWEVETGLALRAPLTGHESPVLAVALSNDLRRVISADMDGLILVRALATGEVYHSLPGSAPVRSLAMTPSGTLVSAGDDRVVRLWDVEEGTLLGELAGHASPIQDLAMSPGGSFVASASDRSVRIWDLANQRQASIVEGRGSPAWRADGRLLAFANDDWDIVIWNNIARQIAGQRLAGHSAPILSLAWHPDGRFLASASEDKTIVLWDVDAGEALARIPRQGRVTDVLWLGDILASAATDRRILLHEIGNGPEDWRARACERAGRNLSYAEWVRFFDAKEAYRQTCPDFPPGVGAPLP